MSKAVAKKEETSLMMIDASWEQDAGQGMEGVDQESLAIPFLTVIQKGSPQVNETDPDYMEEAKAGMLYENVTKTLHDGKKGITIVPCHFKRVFVCFSAAKQFKGYYSPEEVLRLEHEGKIQKDPLTGRSYFVNEESEIDPATCDTIKDTRCHYVLILTETGWRQALLTLSSTQIKKSKGLMALLASMKVKVSSEKRITPPSFINLINLKTVPESNDKGSWYGVSFIHEGFVEDQNLYQDAKEFYSLCRYDKDITKETLEKGMELEDEGF